MLSLNYRQSPSVNLPEIWKGTAIERVVVYINEANQPRNRGASTYSIGYQCSYTFIIPNMEVKVKEIIHIYDYYYDYLYDYYQIKFIFVNLN